MATFADRVEARGVHNQQCGLDGVSQLNQLARQSAITVKGLNLLAQFKQNSARSRKAPLRANDTSVVPHGLLYQREILPDEG